MKIAVIGAGYVGLITAAGLAEIGHQVSVVEQDRKKLDMLKRGEPPFYEKNLLPILTQHLETKRLHFTDDYSKGFRDKQVIYIAVGTPEKQDGSADLSMIKKVCQQIGMHSYQDVIIVTKSTVPVGTNQAIKAMIEKNSTSKRSVSVIANPEFLRQGKAVEDFFNGHRIVIGGECSDSLKTVKSIYKPLNIPIIITDLRSAEMIKYTSNAFLATKISFINEIALLCEQHGANVDDVSKAAGLDPRIGPEFLQSGIGYGGSCLPKDTSALLSIGNDGNHPLHILSAVQRVNNEQCHIFISKIKQRLGDRHHKTIAILGLAFKPETDDMRHAPSITIVQTLLKEGYHIKAYDPIATENARDVLPKTISYTSTIEEALHHADAAVIVTDWREIKGVAPSVFKKYLRTPVVFDGRNCFNLNVMKNTGVEYHSIGRPSVYPETRPPEATSSL